MALEQPPTDSKPRRVRSYVLRTGRITAAQQQALQQYWGDYGLELDHGRLDIVDTFGRQAPLTFEIGFGMGDSLLEMASSSPERDFIGVEVHTPGVGRLLGLAHQRSLRNLRVYAADAIHVLEQCMPDESIDCVQLFFPDPWPKKRHHKRRLIQADFLQRLATKVRTAGRLHIATDWQNYAEHCLALLDASEHWQNLNGAGRYADKPDARPTTKFERRGEQLGNPVWDLLYSKSVTDSAV